MQKGRIIRGDSPQNLKLPRVGLIKTGIMNGKYPKSLDYFIATGKYKTIFEDYYPGKPKTVQIVFWEDDPESMCDERYEYRTSSGRLFAFGNGHTFSVWSEKKGTYVILNTDDRPFLMEEVDKKANNGKGWEIILTIRFILPKIKTIAGYWQYTTKGSKSTIPAIRDTFDAMLQSRGSIRGVIFDLNVEFAKSQKPGVNSRYPVVSLIPNQSKENVEIVKGNMLEFKPNNIIKNG